MPFLGIEIGGTKLQLGVGSGEEPTLLALRRLAVDPAQGAAGIQRQIADTARELRREFSLERIGIGFGGPVDAVRGVTTISHQIAGWEQVPLGEWCRRELGLEARLGNDCDVAALAEATFGAGRGQKSVFYVTVGTGIGGGCVLNGQLLGRGRPAIAEIGHLRPGPSATDSHDTVESRSSGWGIATLARRALESPPAALAADAGPLRALVQAQGHPLNAIQVVEAARQGNALAAHSLRESISTLGWAIAQVITLLAPEVVVVGGGVSLIGEQDFFAPLREAVATYVFPPLRGTFLIVPAALGEEVVVHGAIALARDAGPSSEGNG